MYDLRLHTLLVMVLPLKVAEEAVTFIDSPISNSTAVRPPQVGTWKCEKMNEMAQFALLTDLNDT